LCPRPACGDVATSLQQMHGHQSATQIQHSGRYFGCHQCITPNLRQNETDRTVSRVRRLKLHPACARLRAKRQRGPPERYSWKGMPLPAIICLCLSSLARVADAPLPPARLASFGIPDTLFLVVLALIVFGPKKLPEISRQIGKLLYEFRKASNDFKFQIEEELRSAEQAERQAARALALQAARERVTHRWGVRRPPCRPGTGAQQSPSELLPSSSAAHAS